LWITLNQKLPRANIMDHEEALKKSHQKQAGETFGFRSFFLFFRHLEGKRGICAIFYV